MTVIPIIDFNLFIVNFETDNADKGVAKIAPIHNEINNDISEIPIKIVYPIIPTIQIIASDIEVIAIADLVSILFNNWPDTATGPYPPPRVESINSKINDKIKSHNIISNNFQSSVITFWTMNPLSWREA